MAAQIPRTAVWRKFGFLPRHIKPMRALLVFVLLILAEAGSAQNTFQMTYGGDEADIGLSVTGHRMVALFVLAIHGAMEMEVWTCICSRPMLLVLNLESSHRNRKLGMGIVS